MISTSTQRRGAVLVETLVAISLLAVVMGFLVQFSIQSSTRSTMARQRARAALLAQGKMEEALAAADDLSGWTKTMGQRCPVDQDTEKRVFASEQLEEFRWEWEISRPEAHPGLQEIAVRVFWQLPGRDEYSQTYGLSALVPLSPAGQEGGGQ